MQKSPQISAQISGPEDTFFQPTKAQRGLLYLTALTTLLSGLAGTFQPLLVRLSQHPKLFNALVPYEAYHLSNNLTIACGYLLIFLSLNLFKRKKFAWGLAFSISLFAALLQVARVGSEHIHWLADKNLAQNLPAYSAIPSWIAVLLLLYTRKLYTVESERASIQGAARRILIITLGVTAYGVLGFFLLDKRDFGINFELPESILRTLRELTLIGNSDLTAHTHYGTWFLESLRLYGCLALTGIAYSAFRPIRYRLLTAPKEHELAAAILDKSGNNALDLFKLLPDKSFYFNADRDGFVAYKVEMNVAIALGDATAPDAKREDLIKGFKTYCHNNGWMVAYLQTTPDYLEQYRAAGLRSLKVGEDAVVDLETFVTKTVAKKTFKSVLKKFDKEGFTLVKYAPPHADALVDEVEEISKQWLSLPGRRERGFSLGKFERAELQNNNLYILRNSTGEGVAFVNQIRSYRQGETTIDMMRYKENSPNGTMDCLFGKLLLSLHGEGYKTFSLGLAALSGVGDEPDDNLHEKAMHQVYEHLNRFFSYKGLRNYKAKFEPQWEERFLIYEGQTPSLVKTGIAIAKATEE